MTAATLDVDAEFEAMMAGLLGVPEVDPANVPDWLTDDEMLPTDVPVQDSYTPRHAARYCPWTDVEVPEMEEHPAVEAAAHQAQLDGYGGFITSPTAKHAHDGTALAMIDHAAVELRAALAKRSVPRGVLRALLHQLEAMR